MSYFSSLLHEGLKRFDSGITGISREITAKEQSHNYTDHFINAKELLKKIIQVLVLTAQIGFQSKLQISYAVEILELAKVQL